jgi:hypothetical protein
MVPLKRLGLPLVALAILFLVGAAPRAAKGADAPGPSDAPNRPWSITLYGGRYTDNTIEDLFTKFSPDWEDSYIGTLALAREFATLTRHIRFELEGQVVKHFSRQDHWEFNALVLGRWVTFPWNDYVYTTFAVGEGLSYATEVPRLEKENNGKSHHLLDYLTFELSFSPPQHREWALVTRIHHRSGVFGLFGQREGSNVLAAGLRYRF